MELTNPLIYGVPCFVLFIVAELLYAKSQGHDHIYEYKDLGASTLMGLGSVILAPVVKLTYLGTIFVIIFKVFNPVVNGVHQNIFGWESFGWSWYVVLICQFLDDFAYYWFHRCNHTIRFFWAAHIVHHSSDHFNFGTGIRNGWMTLLYKPFFYMWIPAIGFPPEMLIFCLGIESLWQFQLHSQYVPKLGFIDKFLNTHTMHQVHHASNLEYLDKNHGGYLNVFDRIFGSFKEFDDDVEVQYGVLHPPKSYNPLVIVSHEYREIWDDVKKAKTWKARWMYVWGPPGYSEDGSTMTVKDIHRAIAEGKTHEDLLEKA